jgi:hypothetical protein
MSRNCNDSIKEISCQTKANKMDMYNALRCPEEEIASSSSAIDVTPTTTTTEEPEPKVIIKNPQKMMEDIFDSLDSDVVLDSNRLEETNVQHKVDLDLMMGDQPMASSAADEVEADKKVLLKQPEKKETFPKKTKQKSEKLKARDEDEPMMGDAPCLPCAMKANEDAKSEQTTLTPTTDRQRRDANLLESTTTSTSEVSTSDSTTDTSKSDDESSPIVSSTEMPATTEQPITTTLIEETTTKVYVQGHPLHMSQAIFKEPIQPDVNNTHERIEIGNADAGFIPPMLLVKAKTTTTTMEPVKETLTTDISTDQTLIDVTDVADENNTIIVTSKPAESISESPSNETQPTVLATQLENTITTVASSEKPILIEKRNDPRLGLKAVATTSVPITPTQQIIVSSTVELTTVSEDLTSVSENTESTFEVNTSTENAAMMTITTEETLPTELLDTSSSSAAVSDTSKSLELVVSPSSTMTQEKAITAEKLILSTVATEQTVEPSTTIMSSSPTPIALKQTTMTINKSTTTMRNDIDAYRHSEDGSHEDEEQESSEKQHHTENHFSNVDYEPYKPNRHRSVIKPDHHHGPGFSIGKILG